MGFVEEHQEAVIAGSVALGLLLLLAIRPLRLGLGRFGATLWLWVSFWGSHTVVLVLQGLLLLTVGWAVPRDLRRLWLGRCQQLTILIIMVLNPFWWIKVHRRPRELPKGSIIMSNHLCYVDAWVVAAALFPVPPRFVAMGSLFKMPVFGQVLRLGGHIPVWFYRKEDGRWGVRNSDEIMQMAADALRAGARLVVFPEGTLSKSGHLRDFKDGFFRLAMETGKPIVPMGMWGNHSIFPPGDQFAIARPGRVHAAVGDPIDPSSFDSLEALREHVRGEIIRLRDGLPTFDLHEREASKGPEAQVAAPRDSASDAGGNHDDNDFEAVPEL